MVNEQQPPPAESDEAPRPVNEPAEPVAPDLELPPAVPGPDLPPGYVWAYQPAPEPERPWKAPRWLIILTAIWAAGLVVSGTVYALRGKPTVREQTTIASSQPVVDRAIGNVVTAAGPGPIAAIGSFAKSSGCDITPVRPGVEYVREINLYATPGTESTALRKIAAALPRSYAARTGPGNVLNLFADAGDYVGLIGTVPRPGEVEIKAETGCRQTGPAIPVIAAPGVASVEMAPVRAALNALGVLASSTSAAQIPCPGSTGVMRTVSASGPAPQVNTSLGTALASIAAHPVVSTANLVAYRSGTIDVVASKDPTGVTVSATTRCI